MHRLACSCRKGLFTLSESPIRIVDVARAAGVSLATASRALNDHHEVSDETRQRIKTIAERLGYAANRSAKQLRSGRSRTIGILVASISNPTYVPYVAGAVQAASNHGYSALICDAEYDAKLYDRHLRELVGHQVAALVMSEQVEVGEMLLPYVRQGIPIDPDPFDRFGEFGVQKRASISSAFKELAADLLSLGHHHVAYVKYARPGAPPRPLSNQRISVLREGILSADDGRFEIWDVPHRNSDEAQSWLVGRLAGRDIPTALMVSAMTIEPALRALRELHLTIPHDMSIVSVGEVTWSDMSDPPLSTIGSDQYLRGSRAVKRAIGLAESNRQLVVDNPPPPFRYVRRNSLGKVPLGFVGSGKLLIP